MINREIFSKRLIELRNSKGMMAKEVAADLNIKKATISVYETGRGLPTVEKLCEMADYFGVSLDYLTGRSDNPNINSF